MNKKNSSTNSKVLKNSFQEIILLNYSSYTSFWRNIFRKDRPMCLPEFAG